MEKRITKRNQFNSGQSHHMNACSGDEDRVGRRFHLTGRRTKKRAKTDKRPKRTRLKKDVEHRWKEEYLENKCKVRYFKNRIAAAVYG